MASIHRDPKSQMFRIMFRYGGKQYQKSLKTTEQTAAEDSLSTVRQLLDELARGRKTLPEGADLWEFLFSDGTRTNKPQAPAVVTLDHLFTRYEDEMPPARWRTTASPRSGSTGSTSPAS